MIYLSEHHHFYNAGCQRAKIEGKYDWTSESEVPKKLLFKNNKNICCLNISIEKEDTFLKNIHFETSYYIGLQYIKEWKLPVLIEPKVNSNKKELDILSMLLEALQEPENFNHLHGLMEIDFSAKHIKVDSPKQIKLSPFLIIQFLMTVKQLVKRGLKKSYYTKVENLNNRVRGKILVAANIKQNVLKQRLTKTLCSYQEYGFDYAENRFIKHVLSFVQNYVSNYQDVTFKSQLKELLNYNLAAFYQVGDESFKQFFKKESNPFYKNYNIAFDLGNQLLKLLSHNYSKSQSESKSYPPHWIDMSKLFELYVLKKLKEEFPLEGQVKYHFKTNYQELDFIIQTDDGFKAVVDAKYKPRYINGSPSKEDARQLSGYTRLNSVYKELEINNDDTIIPAYFVYPHGLEVVSISDDLNDESEEISIDVSDTKLFSNYGLKSVKAYKKMYLQEVGLPYL